jgi:hypothetical protein
LFGKPAVMPIEAPKKKRTLMPLLTVVFLASYGLMTMLIVEQGNAIQQQHNLILVLLGDSRELWAMKGKILTDRSAQAQAQAQAQAKSRAQGPSTQSPLPHGQTPSTQTPSTQAPSNQAPSTQASPTKVPQRHSQSRAGKGAKPDTQVPPMPASDLSDQRRVLITL